MDRIEMFGHIAHNVVPKVEHMLDGIDEAIAQPLEGLADATALCLEKMDEFILLKEASDEQCQEYMSDVMKLAVIAMSGHLYLPGGASTASKVAKCNRISNARYCISSAPKKLCARARCPELEMGRNSATPCKRP